MPGSLRGNTALEPLSSPVLFSGCPLFPVINEGAGEGKMRNRETEREGDVIY